MAIEYILKEMVPVVDVQETDNVFDPLTVYYNKPLGRLAAVPPYIVPKKNKNAEGKSAEVVTGLMSLVVRKADDPKAESFTFPIEPLVSVSGKNVIAKRNVLKDGKFGSVKECWSWDDYEITIKGVICGPKEQVYPIDTITKMLELFKERNVVSVTEHKILKDLFGIERIAIESINFPHTKGMNNQNYEIKATSDVKRDLLVTI